MGQDEGSWIMLAHEQWMKPGSVNPSQLGFKMVNNFYNFYLFYLLSIFEYYYFCPVLINLSSIITNLSYLLEIMLQVVSEFIFII